MVIIYKEDKFILVCPQTMIKNYSLVCQKLTLNGTENQESLLEKTFDIKTPFLMDGEAKKIAALLDRSDVSKINNTALDKFFKLKEKNKSKIASLSVEGVSLTKLITEQLLKVNESLKFNKYFNFVPSGEDYSNNNSFVRETANKVQELTSYSLPKISGSNASDDFVIHDVENQKYLIPPGSCYVCGDVLDMSSYFCEESFDFIVIDPPWFNKHVRRRKKARGICYSYGMLSVLELMKIPIKDFLSPKAIVLIWITNNDDINKEFQNSLNIWDLELVTTWYWIKLTKSGEPVVHPSVTQFRGKLPYEKILITKRKNSDHRDIPETLLIASVPSGVHSHKPPLQDILSQVLGMNRADKCLEIFARNLIPEWTSFGYETLRFQNISVLTSASSYT